MSDGHETRPGASIRQSQRGAGLEVIAVLISGITLLATLGGWIWFGGRLAQRVDTLEVSDTRIEAQVATIRDRNSGQDSDIAVTKSQYNQIITRLDRIDAKLDRSR